MMCICYMAQYVRSGFLELNDRSVLFAHDVIAHDDREKTFLLVEYLLRTLFTFPFFWKGKKSTNFHIIALQDVIAELRIGLVL